MKVVLINGGNEDERVMKIMMEDDRRLNIGVQQTCTHAAEHLHMQRRRQRKEGK